jgi:hypothetical protein
MMYGISVKIYLNIFHILEQIVSGKRALDYSWHFFPISHSFTAHETSHLHILKHPFSLRVKCHPCRIFLRRWSSYYSYHLAFS